MIFKVQVVLIILTRIVSDIKIQDCHVWPPAQQSFVIEILVDIKYFCLGLCLSMFNVQQRAMVI